MSGKRQHYIPRFLQKGFLSHKDGNKVFTWVFRKNRPPFNASLKHIGVENFFYSKGVDTSVDDKITQEENKYQRLVESLRERNYGEVSDNLLPEFIAHLEVRTRNLRKNISELTDYMIERLLDFMRHGDVMLKFAMIEIRDEDSELHNEFLKLIEENEGVPRHLIKRWIDSKPEELETLLKKLKPLLPIIADTYSVILTKDNINKWYKDAHIESLKKSISPEVRVNFYKQLNYSLVEVPENNLILGDSAILFNVEGKNNFKVLTDKTDQILVVFLPLNSDRLLLGASKDVHIDINLLCSKIASNSLEYFISSNNNRKMYSLQKLIGNEALLLTEEEIEKIVCDLI